jgi:hypothetical protein
MSSKAVMSLRKRSDRHRRRRELGKAEQGVDRERERERAVDGEVKRFGEESTWVGKYI